VGLGIIEGLQIADRELLIFTTFWFVVGACDELAVDAVWFRLMATGRARSHVLPPGYEMRRLTGRLAVMVPAWQEPHVIGAMIAHTLSAWPHRNLKLYIGCYPNDPATLAAAIAGAHADPRVRLVVHDRSGPSTKADCLNRLYAALVADEERSGAQYSGVVLHDAEDMVHPAGLALIDRTLESHDFVQLPVRPEPHAGSRWVAGHYSDEFTEAHARTLVVRDALGAGIPGAGVGCGVSRRALAMLATQRADQGHTGPFATDCLTEDYELGLLLSRLGARGRFIRARDSSGALVATRAFFPGTLTASIRQKTRWIHGIALQCWDRLGWSGGIVAKWMALRDRRGPLVAVVLAAAYLLIAVEGLLLVAGMAGLHASAARPPVLKAMILFCLASLLWRALWRFVFTAREYGLAEGMRAMVRIPVANIIAIMAGRRAIGAYLRSLGGQVPHWDKTEHTSHPAAS